MTTFYLVRHAHSNYSPDEQRPLSAQGQEEACQLADLLANYPITQIFSSPYLRARQTIEPLANKKVLAVHTEADLRERCLGKTPEGSDFLSVVKQTWFDPDSSFPDGESNRTAQQRAVALIRRLIIKYPEEHLALATHGNLLTLILNNFNDQVDFYFWRALSMPDVYKLQLRNNEAIITRIWQSQD